MTLYKDIYNGKKVLITGHTGFKGSWLSLWLSRMGAAVSGYSLKPETQPNHFDLLNLAVQSHIGDINNYSELEKFVCETKPEIIFHMAAQPLVRRSYAQPTETYETNVMGTLHVCEAARKARSVRAVVAITTDKVYENNEWVWGYREQDRLGGHDPYSASKACAEVLLSSYRKAFWNPADYNSSHNTLLASVRAGNVIGGGDWSEDRLIPDIMKAAARKEVVTIRSPHAIRPWQHVLDCLSGYLLVGQKLLDGDVSAASSWNFGPDSEGALTVEQVIGKLSRQWFSVNYSVEQSSEKLHEAGYLKLDCSRARSLLMWKPVWDSDSAIGRTAQWYRDYYENDHISSTHDLETYIENAHQNKCIWVGA
ncbi:MAG: CDP-glucose 4,6-dehydratase [Chitinivibrionales bacterium]